MTLPPSGMPQAVDHSALSAPCRGHLRQAGVL